MALQVWTQLAPWTQTLHVALGALVWGGTVALAVVRVLRGARRRSVPVAGTAGEPAPAAAPAHDREPPSTRGDTVRAYVALTKPRIIELLLVTTVPAMVLATRDVPGHAARRLGSADVLDPRLRHARRRLRERDQPVPRARHRPAHGPDAAPAAAGAHVTPERAVVFGIVLGAISVGLMAWTVNLLAAFLTLLAIGFYVVVYTIMLKRSTPQNIVIGGAAGALPPVIGWAAVTGNVGAARRCSCS